MKTNHPKEVRLSDVTPAMADAFIAEVERTKKAQAANKYITFLARLFRVLANPGRIETNPVGHIGLTDAPQESRRELTIEELRRVCAAAEGDVRPLMAIGLYTGLRLGDAATLRWSEVDLSQAGANGRNPPPCVRNDRTHLEDRTAADPGPLPVSRVSGQPHAAPVRPGMSPTTPIPHPHRTAPRTPG